MSSPDGGVCHAEKDNEENIGGRERSGKPAAIGRWTFQTRTVREHVLDELHGRVLNACAGRTKLHKEGVEIVRNDVNTDIDADYHVDIADIDSVFEPHSFDVVILDPPFDQKQADEHYESMHARDLGPARKKLAELVRPGGKIIEFGWNTWTSADYVDGFERVEKPTRFKRAIPGRKPIFMVVDRRTQKPLVTDGGEQLEGAISQSFTCRQCGGRLRVTDEGHTDASAWEQHECVDCGGEGEFYISEGTKRDGGRKRGVTKRDYDLQP